MLNVFLNQREKKEREREGALLKTVFKKQTRGGVQFENITGYPSTPTGNSRIPALSIKSSKLD